MEDKSQSFAHHKRRRWYPPRWLIGAMTGEAFWILAVLGWFVRGQNLLPQWLVQSDLADVLFSICAVVAFPIVFVGFSFIWGDDPPYQWLYSGALNVGFGFVFYATLGAMIGHLASRKWQWQFSLRSLLIAVTVIALLLGLAYAISD